MTRIAESELVLNADGTVYHLNLHPDQIARTIITVGDPDRVHEVSKHFDRIDTKVQKREFITHTGELNGKRLTVIGTGIGTDNIDIVFNELDALVNIDLKTRTIKDKITSLSFIRIGTSGCMQKDIPLNSFLISTYGLGLDGLLHFYDFRNTPNEALLKSNFMDYAATKIKLPIRPYFAEGSAELISTFGANMFKGITVTCPGFYAPQGRKLRIPLSTNDILNALSEFSFKDERITNFEMETAAMYGFANMMGHKAVSCNALIANRQNQTFSKDSKGAIQKLIELVLTNLM
jgi:uridine phosphorylase